MILNSHNLVAIYILIVLVYFILTAVMLNDKTAIDVSTDKTIMDLYDKQDKTVRGFHGLTFVLGLFGSIAIGIDLMMGNKSTKTV